MQGTHNTVLVLQPQLNIEWSTNPQFIGSFFITHAARLRLHCFWRLSPIFTMVVKALNMQAILFSFLEAMCVAALESSPTIYDVKAFMYLHLGGANWSWDGMVIVSANNDMKESKSSAASCTECTKRCACFPSWLVFDDMENMYHRGEHCTQSILHKLCVRDWWACIAGMSL